MNKVFKAFLIIVLLAILGFSIALFLGKESTQYQPMTSEDIGSALVEYFEKNPIQTKKKEIVQNQEPTDITSGIEQALANYFEQHPIVLPVALEAPSVDPVAQSRLTYAKALESTDNNTAMIYYLNAINNYPASIEYWQGYLKFLKDNGYDLSYLSQASNIITVALYEAAPSDFSSLLSIKTMIETEYNEFLETIVPEDTPNVDYSLLQEAYSLIVSKLVILESNPETLDFKEIQQLSFELGDYLDLDLYNENTAVQDTIDSLTELSGFLSGLTSYFNIIEYVRLKENTDSFLPICENYLPYSLNLLLSLAAQYRNNTIIGTLLDTANLAYDDIYEAYRLANGTQLFNDLQNGYTSLEESCKYLVKYTDRIEKVSDFMTKLQSASSLPITQEYQDKASGLMTNCKNLIIGYNKERIITYQQWAGNILGSCYTYISDIKSKFGQAVVLGTLESYGYFQISGELLIPQLATIHTSIETEEQKTFKDTKEIRKFSDMVVSNVRTIKSLEDF